METSNQPILFLWPVSPWASKVVHYLTLRGIPYNQCIQPITMPRPDLAALGVKYRRIPVLAYGRDIYCDTLLILQKFEEWYPCGTKYKSISANDPTGRAMEHLLEKWTDVAVFASAAAAIPSEMDLCKDPQFQKDREELWGRPWTKEEQDRLKPAGLSTLNANFAFLEQLLGDGRQWLLGNDGPGLADVHGKSR
jgi:glutathione S-transferase